MGSRKKASCIVNDRGSSAQEDVYYTSGLKVSQAGSRTVGSQLRHPALKKYKKIVPFVSVLMI